MKFGICNEIFKEWEIEKAFRFVKQIGYDAIEIAPFTIANYVTDIPPDTRRKLRNLAQDIGLEISAVVTLHEAYLVMVLVPVGLLCIIDMPDCSWCVSIH